MEYLARELVAPRTFPFLGELHRTGAAESKFGDPNLGLLGGIFTAA